MKLNLSLACAISILILAGIALGENSPAENISIGALVDLTGDWSSLGNNTAPALEIAARDVNSFLNQIGSPKHVALILEDSGTDPAKALSGLQNLSQSGTKIVIAATTSAELAAIKNYADDNGIIIIGTASTATSLAIPDDNLIRLVPDDTNQGFTVSQVFKLENLSAIVPITRGDVWGDDLLDATTNSFEANGGKVLEGVRYSPGTDFFSEVKTLSSLVKEAKSNYGSDNVGVYLISFDEGLSLLAQAAGDPELSSVKWFGSDGIAGLESISQNRSVAQFAANTGLICPIYGIPSGYMEKDDYKRVASAIRQMTGSVPNAYSFTSYDALLVASEAMMLSESPEGCGLKQILVHGIDRYDGVAISGKLNAAGDRQTFCYDLMAVKGEDYNFSWQNIGQLARHRNDNLVMIWKEKMFLLEAEKLPESIATASEEDDETISIGVLVGLTGEYSSQGINYRAALEIAANDVVSYLEEIGSTKRINLDIRDTGSDPATAQRELQGLNQKRIKIVIAATSSAELAAIKDYADENGIIIIGTASTAPSLMIPGDNLIQLAPDDTNQGLAMAQILKHENISAIVPIIRGDVWGDDLLEATTNSFEANGGKVLDGIRYTPGTDFSREVEALSSILKEAKAARSGKVGIYLLSFDEAESLLALAARDPELSSVEWFGCDGMAGLESISLNRTLAQFAVKTGLICPIYGLSPFYKEQDDYKRVANAIKQMTGSEPNAYSLTSYDALLAVSEAIRLSESLNSSELEKILVHTITKYYGITGPFILNAVGDRKVASYDFVAVKEENGSYSWQSIGQFAKYHSDTIEMTWEGRATLLRKGELPEMIQ